MHSFELYMPTRLVYGADSIEKLAAAAAPYGKRALITYGGTQSSRDLCQRRSQTGP